MAILREAARTVLALIGLAFIVLVLAFCVARWTYDLEMRFGDPHAHSLLA